MTLTAFLVPVRALSVIFRAKLKAALAHARLLQGVSPSVWRRPWVVHALHAGRGDQALGYLARYVLRVAISNIDAVELGATFPAPDQSVSSFHTLLHDC